jgi:hypothetical protein
VTFLQDVPKKKIAIVDDDQGLAEVTAWDLEEAGYEPFLLVEGYFTDVNELALRIMENTQGAVCDHRLSNSGLANFYGAELVATLYDRKLPSLLITQYTEMDTSLSIRKCSSIKPKLIIFSIDRNRFKNPHEEIIDGVVAAVPDTHILCTQLSKQCAGSIPSSEPTHLTSLPARGRTSNSCCGGTISINIDGSKTTYNAGIVLHKEFINNQVPTPICRKFLST